MIGSRLGPFVVTALLGKGGMGAVYRAEDASGRAVALKVLIGELSKDPRYVERFRREAQAAEAVVHRNVVACVGSGDDAGTLWIAFELVGGGTLKELVRARQRLPWPEAAKLGAQVARGLAAIHAKGLVHRDMKPANVLLDEKGVAKVGDLGLARGLAGKQTLTMSGELVGTFEYVAPEQTEHAKVDFRADLYSFGAMLYELVTGRPPFLGAGMALIAQHISAVATAPRELVKELPDELDALIRRLLSKQPEVRGESALAVAAELDEIAQSGSRSRPGPIAVAVCAALLLGSAAYAGARGRTTGREGPGPTAASSVGSSTGPASSSSATRGATERARFVGELPEGIKDDGTDYVNVKDGSVLVYVPPASFAMGRPKDLSSPSDPTDEDGWESGANLDQPRHLVTLGGYFISKYEVTVEQFARFVAANGDRGTAVERGLQEACLRLTPAVLGHPQPGDEVRRGYDIVIRKEASWRVPHGPSARRAKDRDPVVLIRWDEALEYSTWAGLELPSEAQWEYAAAGARQNIFPWGAVYPTPGHDLGNVNKSRFQLEAKDEQWVQPVGTVAKDVSDLGVHDMAGNVREWCHDFLDERMYERTGASGRDPLCTATPADATLSVVPRHVVRGASWCTGPNRARTFRRHHDERAVDDLGFRLAYSLEPDLRRRKDLAR